MAVKPSLVITGWSGFVGKSLIEILHTEFELEKFESILLLSRKSESTKLPKNLPSNTLRISQDLSRDWKFSAPGSVLIHLAADGQIEPYSINSGKLSIEITKNLVGWIKRNRPQKVFFASSGVLNSNSYTDGEGNPIVKNEKSEFVISRMRSEQIFIENCELLKIDWVVGRLYTFFGPNILEKRQYLITDLIHQCQSKDPEIVLKGNRISARSYLSQIDLAKWIVRAIQIQLPPDILEIGSTKPISFQEIAEMFARISGKRIEFLNEQPKVEVYYPRSNATKLKLGVQEVDKLIDFVKKQIFSKR